MILLIPSQSLEDFPVERSSKEANMLLSAWSALYHPALIEKSGKLPSWDKASNPSHDVERQLIIIPPCCDWLVPGEWRYTRSSETILITDLADRDRIVAAALKKLQLSEHGFESWMVDAFHAFGTTYLLSELLTRQRRYMSMTSEYQIKDYLLQAITSYRSGDFSQTRDKIRQAFEQLQQGKEYFYPVQAFFIDLTLTAPTTLAKRLQDALEREEHLNLVLEWDTLQTMIAEHPRSYELLKTRIGENRVDLAVDDPGQVPMPLVPLMELIDHLFTSREQYERLLGKKPDFYIRSQFGLLPNLPSILSRIGWQGMLLFSTSGWQIHNEHQSRIDWQGPDKRKISTLARYPVDANTDETYLFLPRRLGRILETDYAPTVTFAHYPGLTRRWLDDLKTMQQYAPALGRFLHLADYFRMTRHSGKTESLPISLFRSNHLSRAVREKQPDPITSWGEKHAQADLRFLALGLATLTSAILGDRPEQTSAIFGHCDSLEQVVNDFTNVVSGTGDAQNGRLIVNPWSFTRTMLLDVSDLETLPDKSEHILHAREFDGRKEVIVSVPGMGFIWVGNGQVKPVEEAPSAKKRSGLFGAKSQDTSPPMIEKTDEGYLLRNEFFELRVDSSTGAIVSLYLHHRRGNRFAQQLAMRLGKEERKNDPRAEHDPNRGYSIMTADTTRIAKNGPLSASLHVAGRLVQVDGTLLCRYEQTITVSRGRNRVDLEMTLDPETVPCGDDPWESYYATRIAWGRDLIHSSIGITTGTFPTESQKLEAPHFVEFRNMDESITVLGGQPFHQRIGESRLDTLLIVPGETARSFRLGFAVNTEYPMLQALDFHSPDEILVTDCPQPKTRSAWLFAVEANNVIVRHWEPIFAPPEPDAPQYDFSVREWGYGFDFRTEQEKEAEPLPPGEYVPVTRLLENADREMIGMRLFLLETEGRSIHLPLRSFRTIAKARTVNFLGEEERHLETDGEKTTLFIAEHELLPVEVYWVAPPR